MIWVPGLRSSEEDGLRRHATRDSQHRNPITTQLFENGRRRQVIPLSPDLWRATSFADGYWLWSGITVKRLISVPGFYWPFQVELCTCSNLKHLRMDDSSTGTQSLRARTTIAHVVQALSKHSGRRRKREIILLTQTRSQKPKLTKIIEQNPYLTINW